MIGYALVGTNDLSRAGAFYDALLAKLGGERFMQMERLISWSVDDATPSIGVCLPIDGRPATFGNGSMVALKAKSRAQVEAVYAKAIELGGSDEGPPGERFGNFFAAYFRDLDGNKLNVFCLLGE